MIKEKPTHLLKSEMSPQYILCKWRIINKQFIWQRGMLQVRFDWLLCYCHLTNSLNTKSVYLDTICDAAIRLWHYEKFTPKSLVQYELNNKMFVIIVGEPDCEHHLQYKISGCLVGVLWSILFRDVRDVISSTCDLSMVWFPQLSLVDSEFWFMSDVNRITSHTFLSLW